MNAMHDYLPKGWSQKSLEEIGQLFSGATPSTYEDSYWGDEIVWVTPNDLSKLKTRHIMDSERRITQKGLHNCSAYLLPKGSLIISSRAPIGYLAIAQTNFCTNQGCKSLVFSSDQNPDFHYYNLSYRVRALKDKGEGTTFAEISKAALGKIVVPVPDDKAEQTAIAEVLATVDRAIAQSEALIAKQRRIKAGLLHDLLTRGIDEKGNLRHPSTHRFKASPVGPVPEEWEMKTLGELSSRITSGSRGWAKYYSVDGPLFVRIGNLTREHIHLSLDDVQHVRPPVGSEGNRTSLEVGDLLISVTADLGIIGVVPEGIGEAYINQHIALVRLDQSTINPWWVGNYLSGTTGQLLFASLNESGAKAGLNLPTVASIPFPVPKMQEQNMIVQALQQADIVVKQEEIYLSKLHRLKAGLMQDLLSGRVSVAGLVETISARE